MNEKKTANIYVSEQDLWLLCEAIFFAAQNMHTEASA